MSLFGHILSGLVETVVDRALTTIAAGFSSLIQADVLVLEPGSKTASKGVSSLKAGRSITAEPSLGRFLVRDPIRYDGGTNLYAYCGNNPINAIDPSGLRENNPLQAVSVGGPSKLNASYQPQWNEIAAEDSISADLEAEIATGNISRIKETLEIAAMSGDPTKFAKLIAIYKAGEQALRNNLSSAPRFDCFSVSETLSAQLTRAGISNTLVRIQADASFMFWNGVRFGETGLHQAVRVGNMIYDKLTGPAGMYVDEYMKIMDKGSINPQMIPWP